MKIQANLGEIEKILGYNFKNKKLLQTAFVHSSFANEHRVLSNERLEFLGDAVIELIITEKLYNEFGANEGDLSKMRAMIVSEKPLAEATTRLGLDKFILKGVGESKNQVESKAIKCDLFEAVCGALYLDGGMAVVKKFFINTFGASIEKIKITGYVEDSKSKLQELLTQEKIVYVTTKQGEAHSPIYFTTVKINGVNMGHGEGSNKKTAEENAASMAINNLKKV